MEKTFSHQFYPSLRNSHSFTYLFSDYVLCSFDVGITLGVRLSWGRRQVTVPTPKELARELGKKQER